MRPLRAAFLFLACAVISACQSVELTPADYQRAQAKTEAEAQFVKSVLNTLQALSFANNREYCGYIGVTLGGDFVASPPTKGRKNSCRADDVDESFLLLASYHTHGAHEKYRDSELPSSDDILADIAEGIDGYVSTPGGRVWYNDAPKRTAYLLCGEGCVAVDPDFDPSDISDVLSAYTLDELLAVED